MRAWTLAPYFVTIALGLAACGKVDAPAATPAPAGELAARVAALDAGPRTIPYSGYVDFDGQPVNAPAVKLNFALFPCATPGTGAGQCAPLWLAKGAWSAGFPAGSFVQVPVFAGRFTVELGATGQTALPTEVFEGGYDALYLALQIEGKALDTLQRIAPNPKSHVANLAHSAELAVDSEAVGGLSADDLQDRVRTWVKTATVPSGGTLEVDTHLDATGATALLFERHGSEWVPVEPGRSFLDDPSLQGYYPFDEAAGSGVASTVTADGSGRGKDLTLEGDAELGQAGHRGKALKVYGGSAATSSLGMQLGPDGLTFAFWMKADQNHTDAYMVGVGRTGGDVMAASCSTASRRARPARTRACG